MGVSLVPLYALIEDVTVEKNELRETRMQMMAHMEQRLQEMHPKEEYRMFYYHSSEDRIVLSHALFWVMTQPQCLKGKIRKERFFLLLRQYEEEMLDAFLTEDDYFPELLRSQDLLKTRDARISGRAERGMSDLRSSLATSYLRRYPRY